MRTETETVARCRYEPDELAQSTYRAFLNGCGLSQEDAPWSDIGAAMRNTWGRLVDVVRHHLDDFSDMPWSSLALRLYDAVIEQPFLDLNNLQEALGWEAACRHLASLVCDEDGLNVEELERSWAEWVRRRVQRSLAH